ncbi:MAG: hypothetical protein ACYTBJ_06970 [Planctomycetota bacterium]|jgi:hypothetical protein
MRNVQKQSCLLLIVSCLLLVTSALAQTRILPKTAKLAPPDTVLLVEIDNFADLKVQFEKTPGYQIYKDPAMQVFVEDAKKRCLNKLRETDNEAVKAIVDWGKLPQGKVAFALVLNKQAIDAGEPAALFITQWGENIAAIKEAVEKMVKKAIEGGAHQKSDDYRGVEIETILAKESSRLGYGLGPKLSYCFIDDCLIGSEDIEVLKFVLAQLKGAASTTLAANTAYNTTIAATGPHHDVDIFVNINKIIETLLAEDAAGEVKMMVKSMGLDNVTAFGCSIGLSREPRVSFGAKALLKVAGEKRGILKMVDFESSAPGAPRFVTASTYSATFVHLSVRKAFEELANLLKNVSPGAAAMMYGALLPPGPDGEPGVQLKRDIVDYLGSQIIIAQSLNKSAPTGPAPGDLIVTLAVNNRKALEKSLSLLHSKLFAAGKPDAKRELLGHTIYLASVPGLPFLCPGMRPLQAPSVQSAPKMPVLAFTVTDTHLLLGTESTVERAIRALNSAESKPITAAKWFTTAKSAIPSTVGLASFEDNVASSEFSWRMMKQSAKSKSEDSDSSVTMGIGMSSASGFPSLILEGAGLVDFSLLPEFDAVRKYFGVSTAYGISRPDGFFFEFKYLNVPVGE